MPVESPHECYLINQPASRSGYSTSFLKLTPGILTLSSSIPLEIRLFQKKSKQSGGGGGGGGGGGEGALKT